MPDPDGPLGAPDHLHGETPSPPSPPRTPEELDAALRGARRSLRVGAVATVAGAAATLLSPFRLPAVLGFVVGFLGLLVVVVAGIQVAVLRGTLAERRREGDEEE